MLSPALTAHRALGEAFGAGCKLILQNGAEFLGVSWEVLGCKVWDVLLPLYQPPGQAVSKICLELKYSSGLGWDFST